MRFRSLLAAAALALSAGPAFADITVLPGPFGGALDPVTLDEGPLDIFINGLVGDEDTPVLFTGAENLEVQGQSIRAATGDFNFLLFTLTDPTLGFTAATFNLDALTSGFATILAYDQFGTTFGGAFAVDAAGQNFFNVTASNNQLIQRVLIMSSVPLADISQIRIGDIGAFAPIPEPAAWAMMIVGVGGVGGVLRRRKRLGGAAV